MNIICTANCDNKKCSHHSDNHKDPKTPIKIYNLKGSCKEYIEPLVKIKTT